MKLFPAISKEQASAISLAVQTSTRDPNLLLGGTETLPSFGEVLAHESDKSDHSATSARATTSPARKHTDRQSDDAAQSPSLAGAALAIVPTAEVVPAPVAAKGALVSDDLTAAVPAMTSTVSAPTSAIGATAHVASGQAGSSLDINPIVHKDHAAATTADDTSSSTGAAMSARATQSAATALPATSMGQTRPAGGSPAVAPAADSHHSNSAPAAGSDNAAATTAAPGATTVPAAPGAATASAASSLSDQAGSDPSLTAVPAPLGDATAQLGPTTDAPASIAAPATGPDAISRGSFAAQVAGLTTASSVTVGVTAGSSSGPTSGSVLGATAGSTGGPTPGIASGPTIGSVLGATAGSTLGPVQDSTVGATLVGAVGTTIASTTAAGNAVGVTAGAVAAATSGVATLVPDATQPAAIRAFGQGVASSIAPDDPAILAIAGGTYSGSSKQVTGAADVLSAAVVGQTAAAGAALSGTLQGVWWAAASAAHSVGLASQAAALRPTDAAPSKTSSTVKTATAGVSNAASSLLTSLAASAGQGVAAAQVVAVDSAAGAPAGPVTSLAGSVDGTLAGRYLAPIETGSRQAADRGDTGDRTVASGISDHTTATVAPLGAFSMATTNAANGVTGEIQTTGATSLIGERAMQQIADGVLVRHASLRVDSSASSFRVVLDPKALGQVVVNVTHSQDGLAISLMTQRPETGSLLHAHLAELMTTLQSSGTGPVHATVALSQDSTTSQGDGSGSNNMSFSSQAQTGQGLSSGGQQQNTPQDSGGQRAPWEPVFATTSGRTASMAGSVSRPAPQMVANKHVDFQA